MAAQTAHVRVAARLSIAEQIARCRSADHFLHQPNATEEKENIMSLIADNASHAVEQVKSTASTTRANLVDLGLQAMKLVNSVRAQESHAVDSVLGHIGLQRRESPLRPLLFFAAGAVVAGSLVLILAPTSGKKLRLKIRDLLGVAEEGVVGEPVAQKKPANGAADEPRVAQNPS
jgi:hypothetical protein